MFTVPRENPINHMSMTNAFDPKTETGMHKN